MHQNKIQTYRGLGGDLYRGINLNWDYTTRTLNISMLGYITKLLHKYEHRVPSKPQHCPYSPALKQYGAKAQAPLPIDISPKLLPDDVKQIQPEVSFTMLGPWTSLS